MKSWIKIALPLIGISSCVKQTRLKKDLTGEYDIAYRTTTYSNIIGSNDTILRCTGIIEEISKETYKMTCPCAFDFEINIVNSDSLTTDFENFNYDNGVIQFSGNVYDNVISSNWKFYAVKSSN